MSNRVTIDFADVKFQPDIKYRLWKWHDLKIIWATADGEYEAVLPDALKKAIYDYIDDEGYVRHKQYPD